MEELRTLIQRGNHKSAKDEDRQVKLLLAKDVHHGFSVPLPVRLIPEFMGAAVQSLGISKQWKVVDPDGTRAIKFRLSQDLSFSSNKIGAPWSVNARVDMDGYPEMTYGW